MPASARSRHLTDAALAGGFLVLGWVTSGAQESTEPPFVYTPRDAVFVVLLVLATVPYAWRRRWPAGAFLLGLLATTAIWLLGYNGSALPVVLIVGAYWLAAGSPMRVVAACGALAGAALLLLWWADGAPFGGTEALAASVSLVATGVVGRSSRLRVELAEVRASAAEERARRAADDERLRIARELHDIVGHSLAVIAVQAGVGRQLMASDPSQAGEALEHISRLSRSSLAEVRAVVATLHEGEPSYRPAPGLDELPALVEATRSATLDVTLLAASSASEEVPRQVGAAAYRIAQEALANVVRHARATSASVTLSATGGLVELVVRDDGTGPATGATDGGHGIAGMRARAEALGGSLAAGPDPSGGYVVTARLPLTTGVAP